MHGKRSSLCPRVIEKKEILLSPQGWGPARNIVAFTGGDLTCCPEFYAQSVRLIKAETKLWVLIETNGYGLTPQTLDQLKEAGVDTFWLDIKAQDDGDHKWLTGCFNRSEISRRASIFFRCSSCVPWEAFRRKMSTPAARICWRMPGASVDGPRVATILVCGMPIFHCPQSR